MTIIFFVALCTPISVWPCTCPNREKIFFFFDIFFNAGSGTSRRMTRMAICTSTASGAMILRRRQHGRTSSKHACTGRFSCRIRCCFTCRSFLVSYILRRGKRRCHPNLFHHGILQSLSLLLDAWWLQRLLHTQYMRFCALEFGFLLHRGDVLLVGLPHRPIPLLEHVDCAATPFHRTHTLVHWLAALVNRLISAQHRALHAALHAVPMNFIFETCFGSFLADFRSKKIFFFGGRCAQRCFKKK